MDCNKVLISGCRINYECLMKDPNKPICDGGMCKIGLFYYQKVSWILTEIYRKTLTLGCRSNYECMMKNHNKPICGSNGNCISGFDGLS